MKKIFLLIGFFGWVLSTHSQNISSLKIEELVKKYEQAKGVLVVNFWSTWCKPCIEEIPHFLEITQKLKAEQVTLLLVSQDTRTLYNSGALKQFITKKGWEKAALVWLNETNADHYCPQVDSSWSGVIPATLIIHPAKKYRTFFEESLSAIELEAEIKKAIDATLKP